MSNFSSIPRQLQDYINEELYLSELYRILSRSAPNEEDRKRLEDFSEECRTTAESFTQLYRSMTGYRLEYHPEPVKESGSYKAVLRSRIRKEMELSKRYRCDYMNVNDNYHLKRAFFMAYHNAMCRAVGLVDMILG